jgi:hypothetical protein
LNAVTISAAKLRQVGYSLQGRTGFCCSQELLDGIQRIIRLADNL